MNLEEVFFNTAQKEQRSPDKIDTLMPLTSSLRWLALLAVGLLVFAAAVWSVFGMIVVKSPGRGIILDSGGVYQVSTLTTGKVTNIYVTPGMEIKAGSIIATIATPESEAMRSTINYEVANSENERDIKNKVMQYDSQSIKNALSSEIVADHDGIVDEVYVKLGDIIGSGTGICTVRRPNDQGADYGVFYVAAKDGKKLEPNMVLQLTPSGTDSALDGNVMASVVKVSQYPVSEEVVRSRTKNSNLAQAIMQSTNNSCMEVTFKLLRNDKDPSGYLWTSTVGRRHKLSAGATVEGFAVIDRISPIEKVFLQFSNRIRTR